MTGLKHSLALSFTFLWIGFVCAISFMEAWLKFQAPGISLEEGLSIGNLVFGALNKVECVIAIIMAIDLFLLRKGERMQWHIVFLIPVALLLIQTIWALPELGKRVELILQGIKPPPSNIHFFYVGMELIKVVSLTILGVRLLKPKKEA